jgi:hypothetical protein
MSTDRIVVNEDKYFQEKKRKKRKVRKKIKKFSQENTNT